jgi:DnaJ-domain-containing protein 1
MEQIAEEMEMLKKNEESELLITLKAMLQELKTLNAKSKEMHEDLHHELREMKCQLYKLAK